MSLEKVSAFMQALGVAYFIWMGYQAPTSQQATKNFVVAAFLGLSLLLLLVKLFGHSSPSNEPPTRPQKENNRDAAAEDEDASPENDDTDYKTLFLAESDARNKYQEQRAEVAIERDQLKNELEQLKAQKPDTTVKDSDPQLEIKLADLRGRTMSQDPKEQACFDLINRGTQSPANFACIEDFNIGGYRVVFRNFPPPIRPHGNHDSITPLYINKPDGKLCDDDIFGVLYSAWGELRNPKLYEYTVPIKAPIKMMLGTSLRFIAI
jgi:hypothetical protein